MPPRSVEEIIREGIARELSLQEFYERMLHDVGPDERSVLTQLSTRHNEDVALLKRLMFEIEERRGLSVAMAD